MTTEEDPHATGSRVLTVAELTALLKELPKWAPVHALYDSGYASTAVCGAYYDEKNRRVYLEERL